MKFCNSCKKEKPLSEFGKRSARPSGVQSTCKKCKTEKEKRRYLENREAKLEYCRKYYLKNKERILAKRREYVANNPEIIRNYNKNNRDKVNNYRRQKLQNDKIFAMADRTRRRVNYALSVGGYRKQAKTEELIGCSWQELCDHIESQFAPGMTWENRGEWEIDHIIPFASAKTEEDVIRLSHYTNMQPLWKSENRRKNGRR